MFEARDMSEARGAPKDQTDLAEHAQNGLETALKAARRPDPENGPHHQAQVEGRALHEIPLEDVLSPSQVHSAHRAGLEAVSEGAFEQFSASAHQRLATLARQPTAVRVRS